MSKKVAEQICAPGWASAAVKVCGRLALCSAGIWLVLLALVAGLPLAAAAQSSAKAPVPVVLDSARQAAREDTAIALHRLFHEKRRRYLVQAGVRGVGAGFATAYTLLVTLHQSDQLLQKSLNVTLSAVFLGLFAHSVLELHHYRARRETRLLTALAAGRPLPKQVRGELKATYFDVPLSSP